MGLFDILVHESAARQPLWPGEYPHIMDVVQVNHDHPATFFEEVDLGLTWSLDRIDDWVTCWHNFSDDTRPLHVSLGMTEGEYVAWVRNPMCLGQIYARRVARMGPD